MATTYMIIWMIGVILLIAAICMGIRAILKRIGKKDDSTTNNQ